MTGATGVQGATGVTGATGTTNIIGASPQIAFFSGSATEVGSSTFVYRSGSVGLGTASPAEAFDMSLAGSIFTNGYHMLTQTNGNAVLIANGNSANGFDIGRGWNTMTVDAAFGMVVSPGSANFADIPQSGFIFESEGASLFGNRPTQSTAAANGDFDVGHNLGVGTAKPTQKIQLSSGTMLIDGNVSPAINLVNGTMRLWTRTMAQIDTMTPAWGDIIMCRDCATPGCVCESSGTAVAQWRRTGTAQGCGSGGP